MVPEITSSGLAPTRRRLPTDRDSITHEFEVGGVKGVLRVSLYPEGTPGELFLRVSKGGSTINGFSDTAAILFSLGLQYGIPLQVMTSKLRHQRFEPMDANASSIVDYVASWLEKRFL